MDGIFCLYNSIPLSICIIDQQFHIVYINNTFENNFTVDFDHVIGQKLQNIIPVFNRAVYLERVEMLFKNAVPVFFSAGLHGARLSEMMSENEEYFNFNISLLKCDSFDSDYAVLSIEVVTELMQQFGEQKHLLNQLNNKLQETNAARVALIESEESLILSNKAKNKLFSIIAHDLKTPLNAMVSISDLIMQNDCMLEEPCKNEDLHLALNISAKQSLEMVSNLLSWARTQLNRITPHPTEFCLCELFNDIKQYFEGSLKSKKLSLEIKLPRKHCQVNVDFDMIKVVIQNLLSNAIKYSYSGGRINIEVEEIDRFFKISISDRGIGMSDDVKQHILSSDDMKSVLGTNSELGTGLGLSVCKEFLKYHNSTLAIRSTEDSGTTISFLLPVNQ